MEENQYTQVLNDIESNKDFTKEEYEEYSKSKDFSVRELIAAYEKTPKDILLKLARDNVVRVRLAVIKNIKFDDDIFNCFISKQKSEITFGDSYDFSYDCTKEKLEKEELEEFAKKDFTQFHSTVLTKVIEIIKNRGIKYLIKFLFENKSIKNNRLKIFIENKDYEIKNYFFKFQRIDEELLKILEKDYDKEISKKASKYLKMINIDFEKMKEELISNPTEKTLINLAYIEDEDVKINLVTHELVTEKVLEVLSNDDSYQVRLLVAKSPLITDNILKNLLESESNKKYILKEIANSKYLNRITDDTQVLFYEKLVSFYLNDGVFSPVGTSLELLARNESISNTLMCKIAEKGNVKSEDYQFELLKNKNINKKVLQILLLNATSEISFKAKEKLEEIKKEEELAKDLKLSVTVEDLNKKISILKEQFPDNVDIIEKFKKIIITSEELQQENASRLSLSPEELTVVANILSKRQKALLEDFEELKNRTELLEKSSELKIEDFEELLSKIKKLEENKAELEEKNTELFEKYEEQNVKYEKEIEELKKDKKHISLIFGFLLSIFIVVSLYLTYLRPYVGV
jgi:hypothetical protein